MLEVAWKIPLHQFNEKGVMIGAIKRFAQIHS